MFESPVKWNDVQIKHEHTVKWDDYIASNEFGFTKSTDIFGQTLETPLKAFSFSKNPNAWF